MRHQVLDREQFSLYVLIAAIGAIPVMLALWRHSVFSSEETLGLLMLAGAIAGVAALLRTARAP